MEELILENSLAGYWDWNIQENTEYLSPTFKSMFGYEDDEMANHPDSWQQIIFREDLPLIFENFEKHLKSKGEQPYDQVVRYHHKNGSIVWVRRRGQIIEWDEEGRPLRMMGCQIDLTSEKELEQKVNQMSLTHKVALSTAGVGIWEFNVEAKTFEWSDEMYALYGQEKGQFIPTFDTWINCIHLRDRSRIREEFELAKEKDRPFNMRFGILMPDGRARHIKARGVAVDHGKRAQIIGTNWDISEVARVQEELETSRNKFEGAFEHSAIGMAIVSTKGKWLKVNRKLCEMIGYTQSELMRTTFQEITHPEDLNIDLGNVQQMLEGKIDTYQMEKRYFHKEGGIVWALLSVSLVRDQYGAPVHFVSQVKDITEEVQAKRELNKTLDVTRKQNERLLNFAHIVSHNLRSHTANLSMMLSFLKDDDLKDGKKDQIMKHIDEISKTLNSTIDHLTEVVKIQTDIQIERKGLKLADFIERILKALSADLLNCDAQVHNNVDPSVELYFNSAYLDSILLNLVSNAIKYRNPNQPLQITFEAEKSLAYTSFSVKDNGLGIDLGRHRHKVFGLNKTFHKHPDSCGVGLFITKNQVEALDGTIEVASEPLVGSTFKISVNNEN